LRHVLAVGGTGAHDFDRLLDHAADRAARAVFIAQRPGPDDVVLLLYTSGTTGEPKGVMHTSNTLMAMVGPYAARFSLGADDVMLMGSPLAHLTGFAYGLMMPVHMGGRAVFLDIWNGNRALDIIRDQGVTFTMGATPFVADLTEAASERRADARTLRGFLSAGAPIPRNLVRRATEILDAFIISAWGMTENGAATSTKPGDSAERVFETDGTPFPGLEIRVVDGGGRALDTGSEGDLQIRGAANFVGYMGRPEAFDTDADGWFKTGDLARMDADGYVRITGRSKDVIIRGGENVPVVEVEGLIYQHPAIAECAVVAMPDERLGERGCCFAVLRAGESLEFPALIAFLREKELSRTYLPERLEIIDAMPKTPSGKIQKNVLRERAKSFV
jgi:cyclohexanecarboxylate-CoA ligase